MTKKLKQYFIYTSPLLALSLLFLFLHSTSPLTLGPQGILLLFLLTYVLFASSLYVLTKIIITLVGYITSVKSISSKRLYYTTSIIAFAPVFLLALSSIGQLELKDFILVSLLVTLSCFYINRRIKG